MDPETLPRFIKLMFWLFNLIPFLVLLILA